MLLASCNLIIYENILIERAREISIISNIKIFFNYNISDHGEAVISRSRIILFNVGLLSIVPTLFKRYVIVERPHSRLDPNSL